MAHNFGLPQKPLSFIDVVNRHAAATGSCRYAQLAENADYNGHALVLEWNSYRGYYVLGYMWAGWNVLARSADLAPILADAKREYARGQRGTSLSIKVRPDHPGDLALLEADKDLGQAPDFSEAGHKAAGEELAKKDFRFKFLSEATQFERYWPGIIGILCNAKTEADYLAAKEAHMNRFRRSAAR